jgi:exonuclease III
VKRALFALFAFFWVFVALGESPAKIRITTWNLEWFPNGSAREATQEKQAERIKAAADVLKDLNPDILLLQEVRDYDACNRLGEAIQPGAYTVVICSAFKGGKQEEAILAKITHGDPVAETAKNIRKREIAIDQLMTHVRDFGKKSGVKSKHLTFASREAETLKALTACSAEGNPSG